MRAHLSRLAAHELEHVHGLRAACAAFDARRKDVVSIVHTAQARGPLRSVLQQAAAARIAYSERSPEDVARLAASAHHEGVCMLVRPRPRLGLEELLQRARPPGNRFRSVCLDGVGNAHNIGAIVRSMAFFGWGELAILGHGRAGPSALAPAAVRVAEGGAEHVRAYAVGECLAALRSLRALGVSVVVATQDAPRSYLELRSWPARAVLVVGAENVGVGDGVRALADVLVSVPGTGAVESLNVSVAAGVLMAHAQAAS